MVSSTGSSRSSSIIYEKKVDKSLVEKNDEITSINSNFSEKETVTDETLIKILEILGYPSELLSEIPDDLTFILSKTKFISLEEAIAVIKDSIIEYKDDENLSSTLYDELIRLAEMNLLITNDQDTFVIRTLAAMFKYSSPYLEVRSTVELTDDSSIPVETFRSYSLAIIWGIVGSGFNEFFSHRVAPITISTSVIQIFLHLCGNLWYKFIPCWGFTIRGKRYSININQPWSKKEQMFSTLLFAICMGTFYTHYNILTQKNLYDDDVSFGYQLLLSLSVQFIGFGFAGMLRRFVVYPSRALWPTVMPTIALNKALNNREQDGKQGKKSFAIFYWSFIFMFLYNWLPTYLMNFLSTFNWMTWIAPNNINLANVTGGITGVGINPIPSFDWNVISYFNPLTVPFWSILHQYVGTVLAALIVLAVYYRNYYNTQYLPMFTNSLYTNKGDIFEVKELLNDKFQLDEEKYQKYSPPFYAAGNLVSYGCFIVFYPLLIVYTTITQSKVLLTSFRSWGASIWSLKKKGNWVNILRNESKVLDDFNDSQSNMMKKYKEVPDWWYYFILIVALVIGIIVIEVYHTDTPVWGLFVSLGFNFAFLIPITMLQATAGFSVGLNLLIEIIVGYALPGNPFALMILKAFGYNIDGQADSYVSNLKIAHYCRIPPIALFRGQMVMVFLQVFVNLGVLNWQIHNISGFCSHNQSAKFSCPDAYTYFNASVVWGVIGPKRMFNDIYEILRWCWLIGALLGLFFGIWKKWGRFYPRNFDPVLFVGGMVNLEPPYTLTYFTSGFIVSFLSQYLWKRRSPHIWKKYNYVVTAGLSAGLILSSIIIFFAVQYKEKDLSWWGNNVPFAGVDAVGLAMKNITLTPKGYFGPAPGHYP